MTKQDQSKVRNLSMTSNGILLSRIARLLAEAGLQRVNFSLDTEIQAKLKSPFG